MENTEEKAEKKKITRRKPTSKKSTTKKETKKTTTQRKPRVKKQKTVVMPSQEEIQEALKEINAQKKLENNIETPKYEEATIQDAVDIGVDVNKAIEELLKDNSEQVVNYGEWQSVMNVLTRMYETSEEDYQNVKYIPNKNVITVNLNKDLYKDYNTEIKKIKNQLCIDVLKYEGINDDINNRIVIIIKKK